MAPRARQAPRAGQTGPTGPQSQFLTPFSTASDRLAVLGRQIDADLAGTGLSIWEERFCQWLALQPMNGVPLDRQSKAASYLAGTLVTKHELKQLRLRPAWREMWTSLRNVDLELKEARAEFSTLITEAPAKYRQMLEKAIADDDVRAATPLLTPLLDRAMPKQVDPVVTKTSVHITLSTHQAAGIDAKEIVVEAQDVVVEA